MRTHPDRLLGQPARLALLLALSSLPSATRAAGPSARPSSAEPESAWARTLEAVVPSVVVIRIRSVRPFDTERAAYSVATGFVVDADAGLILTNRHVVGPGPTVAEAVFADHEEVELAPVYRDPIHDFGIYRFDPKAVRYQALRALPLKPDHATVGREIRVVGNDAGEKLSILAGTIARVDRAAPSYGRGRFNDFNTFYIQAASSTSGGSSGSPVIDVHGHVVALNAGGRMLAASSYYLPLDRVGRALDAVRDGRPLPRGTLGITLAYRPYHEVRRLGTQAATEQRFRKAAPGGHGMLVVERVLPGGPADGVLQVGDVLVAIDRRLALDFLTVESVLDAKVGASIGLLFERAGQTRRAVVTVADLHALTPSAYLEMGGAILNQLSYQVARHYDLPLEGVYVARDGYMLGSGGIERGSVITAIDGKPVRTLDDARTILGALGDGARVLVRAFLPQDRTRTKSGLVTVDRRYFPARLCTRDDRSGRWPCTPLPEVGPAAPPKPATVALPKVQPARLQKIADALVEVRYRIPYRIDGAAGDTFAGAGVVLDARRGLVVTDRDTVAVPLGDCTLTFGGSLRIPAEVLFVHPLHDIAVVRYDPRLLGDTPVRAARLRARPLAVGETVDFVGLSRSLQIVAQRTEVTKVDTVGIGRQRPPRFRERNLQVVTVADTERSIGGVLADRQGRVAAFWFSVLDGRSGKMMGLPTRLVTDHLPTLRRGQTPEVRTLGLDLSLLPLADARERGLEARWIQRFQREGLRRVLSVRRIATGAPAREVLEDGDLLLRVNGRLGGSFATLEAAERGARVRLTVLREGKVLELAAHTLALSGRGTTRLLRWAGALLQPPHWALAAEWGQPREGVYVSWVSSGSPAQRYGLEPTRRIVAVDGAPIPDLDAFLAAVAGRPERGLVRLDTVDLYGRRAVVPLLLDLESWPTFELRWTAEGWRRSPK